MTEQPLRPSKGYEKNGIFAFPNYSRPDGTNVLFASSGKRKNEVLIGGEDNDWGLYCMGYWRAADALADHLTQARNPYIDRPYAAYWESQAYAILFLYRHYLELRLKELFLAYGGDAAKINREHGLLKIWEAVRKQEEAVLTEAPSGDVLIDLDIAEKIVIQFDKIDRDSQAFRYPKDRKGNITIAPMQIDLIRLKTALGWLSQFLDGWSVGIYEYRYGQRD
jgi:hypothetical protein